MEQQEVQVEEGINLVALLKLLFSKIKYLILAALIGGLLGGSFAVWRTINVDHYGTRVEFYVNPEKKLEITDSEQGVYGTYSRAVMDGIVKLLGSESFAEEMILDGSDLPEKDVWVNPNKKEEVELDLNTKIQTAEDSLALFNAGKDKLISAQEAYEKTDKALEEKKDELDDFWASLYYNGIVKSATFDEKEYTEKIKNIQAGASNYDEVQSTQQAYKEWDTLRKTYKDQEAEIKELKEVILPPLQAAANQDLEDALEDWRTTEKYKKELKKYSSAMEFTFLVDMDDENLNEEARSFIYVEIFVLNDKDFAEKVLKRVKKLVPEYVEQRMTVPDGYTGTNCSRITRTDDIRLTNPGYTTNQAIKYAFLSGVLALVIACVAVLLADKADKRLRDISVISKQFNVPVLGMIPSMGEMENASSDKKSNEKEAQ